ncbi:SDR family NAD(P)-dependent oxidoreductase [Saccharopolyspora sp. NPDC000359]|uniref:SDR family NAD(P)-dependent oxidoreductase n=1 Tax=Saccharopolyspora sp. NPDC000359 TaxID=3154251 RepID=UPI00332155C7
MRKFAITGGTDGMGRALALALLERGHHVAVIGRSPAKGAQLLDAAAQLGAGHRARFIPADLSLISGNRAAIAAIRAEFSELDGLVLGARYYRSDRVVTAEGFESTFALSYLSRYVLSHELSDLLDAAPMPVVLNICGPGSHGEVRWDDLQLGAHYHGQTALSQSGPLNDLLGVSCARSSQRARYVLYGPGLVNTSFAGQYDAAAAAQIDAMRTRATPVTEAITPMLAVLDQPPAAPLSAYSLGRPLSLDGPGFDPGAAQRLHRTTQALLVAHEQEGAA